MTCNDFIESCTCFPCLIFFSFSWKVGGRNVLGSPDTGVTAFQDRLLVAFPLWHLASEAAGLNNLPGFFFLEGFRTFRSI